MTEPREAVAKVAITLSPLLPDHQRIVFLSGAEPDRWQERVGRFLGANGHIFGPEATGCVQQMFATYRAAYEHVLKHGREGWVWPPLTLEAAPLRLVD